MPKDTIRRTSTLAAIAIAVAGAGLVIAAPAQAAPGNCDQWEFSGATNAKLSTGPILTFEAKGTSAKGALATDARSDNGTIRDGSIEPNGFIYLVYVSDTFPDDPPLKLVGDVTPDGKARGNFTAKLNGTWELTTPLNCKTPAAGGAGQGQGGNSREVTGDVDAYDSPGGTGAVIGMLHGGDRVNLGSGCRDDNWCNVAFPGGPGGTAWVWGDFLK
jgi:hypothetical protein